jgi:NAD(P)H-hydrate epimerase
VKLVTAAQMRALEQAAVEAGTSLDALMENAGLAVAQEVWMMLGVVAGRRILHLAEWEGDVVVYLLASRDESDANLAKVRALDVPIFVAKEDAGYERLQQALDGAEIVVDALLGTGGSRAIEPTGTLADILRRADAARTPTRDGRIRSLYGPR